MEAHTLELGGWLLLLGSWTMISGLVLFCIRRITRSGGASDPTSE